MTAPVFDLHLPDVPAFAARPEGGDEGQAGRRRADQLGPRIVEENTARFGRHEVVGPFEDLTQRAVEANVPVLGVLVSARPHEESGDLLGREGDLQRRNGVGICLRVAFRTHLFQPHDLRIAHRVVVDIANLERVFLVELEAVDADDHILAPVDAGLTARGRFLDVRR